MAKADWRSQVVCPSTLATAEGGHSLSGGLVFTWKRWVCWSDELSDGRACQSWLCSYGHQPYVQQYGYCISRRSHPAHKLSTIVIDELHRLENHLDWFLTGALDLERLAVLGYSLGGEAASQVCVTEERIKAGIALDSCLWGNMFGQSVRQPFFCIIAENYEREIEPDLQSPAIILRGTKHASFGTGAYGWEAQAKTDIIGTLATARCHEITHHFVLAFINYYLCNVKDDILDGITETYPEASYLSAHLV